MMVETCIKLQPQIKSFDMIFHSALPSNWLLTPLRVNSPYFPRLPCVAQNFPPVGRNAICLADAWGQGCIRMPCVTTLSLLPSGRLSAIQSPFAFQPLLSRSRLSQRKRGFFFFFLQIGSLKIPNALNLWQNGLNPDFSSMLIYVDHLEKPFV